MKSYSDLTNRTEDCVDTMYHLINSSDENARAAIASHGFDDEYFSNDESPIVRIAVAEHTKDINILKKLSHDEMATVRMAVVQHTDNEDILKSMVNDIWIIRAELAKNPCVHPLLMDDTDVCVRRTIAETTNDTNILNHYLSDEDVGVRENVALRGFGHDVLVKDNQYAVLEAIAKTSSDENILSQLINAPSSADLRLIIAERGLLLDELQNDHWHEVRKAVATNAKDAVLLHDMAYNEVMKIPHLFSKENSYSVLWSIAHNENVKKDDKSGIYKILKYDSFYADKINEERTARPQKQSSDIKTERN